MARELADVLHHFLGEAPPGERLDSASLALLAEPDDALAVGVAWNLAHELARLGLNVAWVTSLADEELLPQAVTPGLLRLLSRAEGLPDLWLAAAEASAKLAAAQAPSLVLLRVPPGWIQPSESAERLLGWTLQLVGPDSLARERALRLAERVRHCQPAACLGVALHDVRSVHEAESAFTALDRAFSRRSDASLTSYGLLLDEAEVYRSLLARRPLLRMHPETRAASALGDMARLLRADFANDAA
jgi:hypothetical protein